jgi:DNA-binding MarR family transcriptional regulator/N-acetylglutamate synthase-like GNAT family acetyltransferase
MAENEPMPPSRRHIDQVRSFNRFYTRRIGLLREGLLDTPFSLTQARILFELGTHPGTRSADLAAELGLDAGYLSRVLASFERRQLVRRARSATDGRARELSLTAKGQAEFQRLNVRSQDEVRRMLSPLHPSRQEQLMRSMATIRHALDPDQGPRGDVVLRPHRPGDIGWVIARHGELYALEYQWDTTFEGLVAGIAGRFLTRFDERRERCWIAELEGERVGCVFLVKASAGVAKLRLLLVEPHARGRAIGSQLVDACVAFARQCGYRKLTLWTNDILHAARGIYTRAGFRLVKEDKHRSFGHELVGQYWELEL